MLTLRRAHRRSGDWRDARNPEVTPNLRTGVGLVRGGSGTALVGSHSEVADRIAEYAALGIEYAGLPLVREIHTAGSRLEPATA